MVQCEMSVRWQLDEKACRSLVAILPNPEHASLRRDQVWQSRASRLPRRLECPLARPDRRQRAFVGEIGAAGDYCNRSIGQLDFHFRALPHCRHRR